MKQQQRKAHNYLPSGRHSNSVLLTWLAFSLTCIQGLELMDATTTEKYLPIFFLLSNNSR